MRGLLDTAVELFARNGYAGTTIDQIAKVAHVGKPTIYAHYGNKAELLKASVDYVLRHRLVPIDRPVAAETAEDALREQLANILSASLHPSFLGLFRIYLNESSRFPKAFEAFSPELHTQILLVRQMERFSEFDSLRVSKAEAARTMLEMTGMTVLLAATGATSYKSISPDGEAARIVAVALHGLLPDQNGS